MVKEKGRHRNPAPLASAAVPQIDGDGDFVDELLAVVVSMAPDFNLHVQAVAVEIRKRYGGERVYVARRRDLTARDAAIRRDFELGERVPLLARRYHLSRARVWEILGSLARPAA